MKLEIINPIHYKGWDDLVVANQKHSFFHSSCWARVLHNSYQYNPRYFTLIKNGKLLTCVPVMEIQSFLTGDKAVSLPFTDYCNPILARDIHGQEVIQYLLDYGHQAGWKFIEIRGGVELFQDSPPFSKYYGHTLTLGCDSEKIFSKFRNSTKRNIRKAVQKGAEVEKSHSIKSMQEFYRLNCITRKRHGIPPQPYSFFKNIHKYVISQDHGFIMLAYYQGRAIAGAMYFQFGKKGIYKYGASDKRYQYLRANNLIMWEAIKWYCQKGYNSFCFGRTEQDNIGLRQFKNGWGTVERDIYYYRYDFKKQTYINANHREHKLLNTVFRNVPIQLLKVTSKLFYKHTG